ncbi:MAG: DUF7681 family protein [Plesiomonas shigelloides]
MDNQHKKITGYRELSQVEIDLMNRIKSKGDELITLQKELTSLIDSDFHKKSTAANRDQVAGEKFKESDATIEFHRFMDAEPRRWADIGKTNIQLGIMALVRAVAQPSV